MKVEHGDIVLFHSHGFLPEGIQFFMNIYRWLRLDFKPFYKKVANHAGMGAHDNSIIEAVADGVKVIPFDDPERLEMLKTITVYRYPWSENQLAGLEIMYDKLEGKKYQFTNFLSYIVFIFTLGLYWPGKNGPDASERIYCSEFDATCIYYVTTPVISKSKQDDDAHKYFKGYWKKSPYQVEQWAQKNCTLVTTYEIKGGKVYEV